MAQRTLELTLISAKDLKDVNLLSKMEVYAVVALSGDPRSRQRIATDRAGGRNPTWNATLRFTVPASGAGSLHVLLRAERALGDRDVGEVHIPLSELLSGASDGAVPAKFVAYQVRKISSGKPQGVLNFSYKLGEVTQSGAYPGAAGPAAYAQPPPAAAYPPSAAAYPPAAKADGAATAYPPQSTYPPPTAYPPAAKADGAAAAYPPPSAYPPPGKANEPSTAYPPSSGGKPGKAGEPVTAYPAAAGPSTATPYAAPPQQYGYGYPAQPPAGYGYPPPPPQAGYSYGYPPQAGYGGYQQQAVKPPKKNNFGMGLGAGLLGGALGGLLIGDAISDASAYDSGYDAGFDDGGGFDF
ncbi:hypothetical protein E2562_006350 [Oryza meyeriana var. granulata]|uniref:C2 domain-containing protein n=1 Tax=Oryza meyeriana var. granulata TaxID=110450 RepID=A0A6G1EHL8_9ORYZ|nr:hypothetical protein E2562_006350 [Oryza meyeriana var. granulata]